jgi:hypothetical protein
VPGIIAPVERKENAVFAKTSRSSAKKYQNSAKTLRFSAKVNFCFLTILEFGVNAPDKCCLDTVNA